MAAGLAEGLPAGGRRLDSALVVSRWGSRVSAACVELARAPARLLDVSFELRASMEVDGGMARARSDAVALRVEARLTRGALQTDRREGTHGAEAVLRACLAAAKQAGQPAVNAVAKASGGVHLPPRAVRVGREALRSLRGMLDALVTEGTAAPTPSPPAGLRGSDDASGGGGGGASAISLSEYQFESLGAMLARERSAHGLSDLLETSLGEGAVLTSLPGGGATFSTARRPTHRGGILAEGADVTGM